MIHSSEATRIRAEYSRRAAELPSDFYRWNRPVNLFFHTQTLRACIRALVEEGQFPLGGRNALDVGCGSGIWLAEYAQWGTELTDLCGIDLSEDRLGEAKRLLPGADLRTGDACELPWPAEFFSFVTQFTMFTSILDASVKRQIASEMLRVLKPDGTLVWYDFRYNNPCNPNVRGIEAAEIKSLFPGCAIRLKKMTLAPPIARRVVPVSWVAALILEKVPILRTHYLGVIRKLQGRRDIERGITN